MTWFPRGVFISGERPVRYAIETVIRVELVARFAKDGVPKWGDVRLDDSFGFFRVLAVDLPL
jgi:hypothetical protein